VSKDSCLHIKGLSGQIKDNEKEATYMGVIRNVHTLFVKKNIWETANLGHLEVEGENTKVVLQ
jgi:hypothetical protein